ncbi:MAG: VOC family protein, partial [Deltaproteobacteria bacterium]|nr:VOC family protein [Deltaproteobacteria bacterium]
MNAINWFEIPTRKISEAKHFYEQILAKPLKDDSSVPGFRMALLPYTEPGVGGALVEFDQARPHGDGVRVY